MNNKTREVMELEFIQVVDVFKLLARNSGKTIDQIILSEDTKITPRYFQVIFWAVHEIMFKRNKRRFDSNKLSKCLEKIGDGMNIPEGGRWGAESKKSLIKSVIGQIDEAFSPDDSDDPSRVIWVTRLQNLLTQSYTEQSAYDFKQGFLRLDSKASFDEDSFIKILKTCVGISNIGDGKKGYVVIGVAEGEDTIRKIERLYSVHCEKYGNFYVSGVDREFLKVGKSPDHFFQMIVDKIKQSKISEPLRSYIASNIKNILYYERTVYVLEVIGMADPSLYGDEYYDRKGNSTELVKPVEFPNFMRKYKQK